MAMMQRVALVVLAAAGLLALANRVGSTAPPREVRLMAFIGAASKPPAEEAKAVFEKAHPNIKVDITFGGSGTLLQQIKLEEIGDIYMP